MHVTWRVLGKSIWMQDRCMGFWNYNVSTIAWKVAVRTLYDWGNVKTEYSGTVESWSVKTIIECGVERVDNKMSGY